MRIRIDKVPPNITLAAGMTATVVVTPKPTEKNTTWGDIRDHFADLFGRR